MMTPPAGDRAPTPENRRDLGRASKPGSLSVSSILPCLLPRPGSTLRCAAARRGPAHRRQGEQEHDVSSRDVAGDDAGTGRAGLDHPLRDDRPPPTAAAMPMLWVRSNLGTTLIANATSARPAVRLFADRVGAVAWRPTTHGEIARQSHASRDRAWWPERARGRRFRRLPGDSPGRGGFRCGEYAWTRARSPFSRRSIGFRVCLAAGARARLARSVCGGRSAPSAPVCASSLPSIVDRKSCSRQALQV
jgi:hypothetical protein